MDNAVLRVMAQALWDPNPTTTDEQSCQLAQALGYPDGWRVVRQKSDDDLLFDRIYSGDPTTPQCDCWLNHAGAMEAAATWYTTTQPVSQFSHRGGDLTPLKSSFRKGDKVQVLYDDEWWDAKIMRVRENAALQTFTYSVSYMADATKQSGVDQSLIRPLQNSAVDPEAAATKIGFPAGWQAFLLGRNRWKLISPKGVVYRSKKAALASLEEGDEDEDTSETGGSLEGDPPWRTEGDEYIGRSILKVTEHHVSARRTITIEQEGVIVGWISAEDVDKDGKPGFVSERTGKPAKLYNVKFKMDNHSAYADQQLTRQDMEEYEILESLLPTSFPVKDTRNKTWSEATTVDTVKSVPQALIDAVPGATTSTVASVAGEDVAPQQLVQSASESKSKDEQVIATGEPITDIQQKANDEGTKAETMVLDTTVAEANKAPPVSVTGEGKHVTTGEKPSVQASEHDNNSGGGIFSSKAKAVSSQEVSKPSLEEGEKSSPQTETGSSEGKRVVPSLAATATNEAAMPSQGENEQLQKTSDAGFEVTANTAAEPTVSHRKLDSEPEEDGGDPDIRAEKRQRTE